MDPATIAAALSALAPVITATVEALTRGGDWRQAAREALDSAEAADRGLAGPRADEIEARHIERLIGKDGPYRAGTLGEAVRAHAADVATLRPLAAGAVLSHEQHAALGRLLAAAKLVA